MSFWSVTLFLLVLATLFAAAGVLFTRGRGLSLEDYIAARGSVGTLATAATIMASVLGGWVLFSPAEAGTWGGLPALLGYALGQAAPLVALVFLGHRLRILMPEGHSLAEFVEHRYGRPMHLFTVMIMVFYMFVFLAAEITGMSLMVALIADVPLWLTASVALAGTLAYTAYGGLRASIITDGLQSVLILPLFVVLVSGSLALLGGWAPVGGRLVQQAPQLLRWDHIPGVEFGATLFLGVLAANLFHQGYWQRVYAVRDRAALRRGFLLGALAVIPVVFGLGMFGLAAVALGRGEPASVALFNVLLGTLPGWLIFVVLALGLALVMSSADTLLNGIASLVAVEGRRLAPRTAPDRLLQASRWITLVLALPVLLIAAQGYSVLYLFLIADLVCAAATFPVFYGLFNARYDGRAALISTALGLVAGAALFPDPAMSRGNLLWAFGVATFLPVLVSFVLLGLSRSEAAFDYTTLQRRVRLFTQSEAREGGA